MSVHEHGRKGEATNSEPSAVDLTSKFLTTQATTYRRNHGDFPWEVEDEEAEDWTVTVSIDEDIDLPWQEQVRRSPLRQTNISLKQIQNDWPMRSVVAAMECAGNRRSDMSALDAGNTIEGVQWGQSALANCRWFGVALRDMLLSMGIPDPYVDSSGSVRCDLEPNERSIHQDSADWSRSLHVHFISSQVLPSSESKGDEDSLSQGDVDQQKNRFGSSISLATALHPNTQVLLSYSVNTSDEALDTEHGYPLRMVIPGHLAARWTKWLNHIRISRSQNASEPMMQDYKILQPPPGCSQQERSDWLKSMSGGSSARRKELLHQPPMVRLGVGSSISSPAPSQIVQVCAATQSTPYPYLEVSGYAVGSEGSPVSKIELAIVADDSDSNEAAIRQKALDMDQWLCLTADNSQQQTPSSLQGRLVDEGNPPHVPTWSWTLWQINLPTNAVMTSSAFNIVVRAHTRSGICQEMQSAWNLRGFRERSWPVVRNLRVEPTALG